MKLLVIATIIFALGAGFFLFAAPRTIRLHGAETAQLSSAVSVPAILPPVPEAATSTSSPNNSPASGAAGDIPNQQPLSNPPETAHAIYLTGWSAGSESKRNSLIDFMQKRGLNAAVVDIKDYSGYVAYQMDVPEVKASGAGSQIRILKPNALVKEFHDNNIYVIARITVFQDPVLAKAHPEWALKNKTTGRIWLDNRGLAWLDPAATPVWDYDIAIAKDALSRGFDEVNFDYVRFASDGSLDAIGYPFWDKKTPRRAVIKKFFAYLREELPDAKISADLFGLATADTWDDLGIGQVIEDAYPYFDYVSPMVYPSHYAAGTLGYKNPAKYPYEIIKYSMEHALARLQTMTNNYDNDSENGSSSIVISHSALPLAKLRPWLQAFDLGAVYNSAMIDKEIQAVNDVFFKNESSTSSQQPAAGSRFGGWLLWDPANNYSSYR